MSHTNHLFLSCQLFCLLYGFFLLNSASLWLSIIKVQLRALSLSASKHNNIVIFLSKYLKNRIQEKQTSFISILNYLSDADN